MSDASYGPKPLFPALDRFYAFAIPFSWLVIRVAVGWNLIVHGWGKLARGVSPAAPAFTQMGFEPGVFWAWLLLGERVSALQVVGMATVVAGMLVGALWSVGPPVRPAPRGRR